MKKHILLLGLFILLCSTVFGQDQALYFNGNKEYAEFDVPALMPSGSANRTVQFWMKSDLKKGAKDNHESVIELGEQAHNGSAFGLFTAVAGDKTNLYFWGHNADKGPLATIPDDQWHFYTITYEEPYITCYLDGELSQKVEIVTAVGGQRLNTKTGKAYIGGYPKRGWYFSGAVDNLRVWNYIRTPDQIRIDMVGWPRPSGTEAGLVLAFDFNEGQGKSFADLTDQVSGILKKNIVRSDDIWTQPIASNPEVYDEGIWFVIQNKSLVDSDLASPAQANALTINSDNKPEMAKIPYAFTSNYDAFLWKAIAETDRQGNFQGKYKLVNKKHGDKKALSFDNSGGKLEEENGENKQKWSILNSNLTNHGTNAFVLSNAALSSSKNMVYDGSNVVSAGANSNDTRQVWLLQPMKLWAGYHLPAMNSETEITAARNTCQKVDCSPCSGDLSLRSESVHPFVKKICVNENFSIFGTNTTSDWALLNTQLIYKNIINSFLHPGVARTSSNLVMVISKYDRPELVYQYKNVYSNESWLADTRGYAGSLDDVKNNRPTTSVITEEMMCRKGKIVNRPKDQKNREFEQVVHEFGHTINYVYFLDKDFDNNSLNSFLAPYLTAKHEYEVAQKNTRDAMDKNDPSKVIQDLEEKEDLKKRAFASADQNRTEWFPWTIQKRYDNSKPGDGRNDIEYLAENEKTAMDQIINPNNTWFPPRKLREMEAQ